MKTQTTSAYAIRNLLFNHLDAWGVTFVILTVFLVIHDVVNLQNVLLLFSITGMYWFGFAVNDYYDTPYDRIDANKSQRNAFLIHAIAIRIFVVFGFATVLLAWIGFVQFGLRGLLTFTFSLVIVWAYSAPPLRLKSRPILDLLTHGLFVETYPYLLGLILIQPKFMTLDLVMIAFFFLSSIAAQLEQQLRDYDTDSQVDRNFTTTFGRLVALKLLKIASAGLFVIGGISVTMGVLPVWIYPLVVLGTPVVLHRFLRSDKAARPERLIRYSVLSTIGYVCLLWGWVVAG